MSTHHHRSFITAVILGSFRKVSVLAPASLLAVLFLIPSVASAALTQILLTNSNQINPSDDLVLGAANFYYPNGGQAAGLAGTVNGVRFDDNDLTGPLAVLSAYPAVTVSNSFVSDPRARFQNTAGTIAGADAATLQSIANTISYLGSGESNLTTFDGLGPNRTVSVQIIGGDSASGFNNWLGNIQLEVIDTVTAAITNVGAWNNVGTEPDNTDAKLATFTAVSDSAGRLQIRLAEQPVPPGEFVGFGAAAVYATTNSPTFDLQMTDSGQIVTKPFVDGNRLAAAVNFDQASASGNANGVVGAATVRGVKFDDVDVGTSNVTNLALTQNQAGVTLTTNFSAVVLNRPRSQSIALSGIDSSAAARLLNDLPAIGIGEQPNTVTLSGLYANTPQFVQLFGGDELWGADAEVYANGNLIGLWTTVADNNTATASTYGFYTTSDALGQLTLDLRAVNVGGLGNPNYFGWTGFMVTQVPEPASAALLGMGLIGMIRSRRRNR